jgi:hypothetical protein
MALNTQLQGYKPCPLPGRKPLPRQLLQPGKAKANVSDLVHSIFVLSFGNPEVQPSSCLMW